MKNKNMMRIIITVFSMIMIFGCMGIQAFAENDGKMAYNIYSDPDRSMTNKKFDTFLIDFRGVQTPAGTYWALANWGMDLTASSRIYSGISGGGAYAGLQNTGNRMAIMSFWQYKYQGDKILNASRMFPSGNDNSFGGEGEGTNWIGQYLWNDNSWYRMVLHCWTDAETGTTFVGQWFMDEATGNWTLISYFDTKLTDSFFTGNMSQFQENFSSGNAEPEREFNYKNMYVLDHVDGKWKSLATSTLSCDYNSTNKKGTREFGATDEFFWGKAAGVKLDNQTAYNSTAQKSAKFTIKQPETPTLGKPSIKNIKINKTDSTYSVTWTQEDASTPQLSYKVELFDTDGNVIATQTATRPEVTKLDFKDLKTDVHTCKVTLTDVFGTECSGIADSETKFVITTPTISDDAPKAELKGDSDDIKEAVLSDDDEQKLASGSSISVRLNVDSINASDAEKNAVYSVLSDDTNVEFLDISLIKSVDGVESAVHKTDKPVRITVDIPESMRDANKTFVVVRVHDGVTTILTDLDQDPNTVTFETDSFSTYAISYADNTPTPGTGDSISSSLIWTFGLSVISLAAFTFCTKRRFINTNR